MIDKTNVIFLLKGDKGPSTSPRVGQGTKGRNIRETVVTGGQIVDCELLIWVRDTFDGGAEFIRGRGTRAGGRYTVACFTPSRGFFIIKRLRAQNLAFPGM